MGKVVFPRSDRKRIAFLEKAVLQMEEAMKKIKDPPFAYLIETFRETATDMGRIAAGIRFGNAELLEAMRKRKICRDELEIYVRDFMVVFKRRSKRLRHPASLGELFDVKSSEFVRRDIIHWETLAVRLISGDREAVALGYPPMQNPSADELEALQVQAQPLENAVKLADQKYMETQAKMAALRDTADKLARTLAALLQGLYLEKDAPAIRRIMRRYGFRFDRKKASKEENPTP